VKIQGTVGEAEVPGGQVGRRPQSVRFGQSRVDQQRQLLVQARPVHDRDGRHRRGERVGAREDRHAGRVQRGDRVPAERVAVGAELGGERVHHRQRRHGDPALRGHLRRRLGVEDAVARDVRDHVRSRPDGTLIGVDGRRVGDGELAVRLAFGDDGVDRGLVEQVALDDDLDPRPRGGRRTPRPDRGR
jgi:hypothetical protein